MALMLRTCGVVFAWASGLPVRLMCIHSSIFGLLAFRVFFVVLVEIRQRVTNVFELDGGTFFPKIERVHLYGLDEARKRYLLESLVDKVSNRLCKFQSIRACCQVCPVDID